jgi:hypothetical protein
MRVLTLKRWRAAEESTRRPTPQGRQASEVESLGRWLGEMRSEIETIHHELDWVTAQLRAGGRPTEHVWPKPQDEKTAKLGSEYWLG